MRLSISKIKSFKSCRRKYELRYVEGLTPIKKPDALETGSNYHEILADMYSGKEVEDNFSKERAMAEAYKKYIMPEFKVTAAEVWLEKELTTGDKLVGIADGLAKDGNIVEHKTTSGEITEAYEYQLQWDEQILAYMYLTGARKVYYTVCRKPTIRQKKDESEEEFYNRMVAWYDEDTDKKIRLLILTRTDNEVAEFEQDLIAMANEMRTTGLYYKNTGECMKWGRMCEYASVCQYYDPNQEYIEFEKQEVAE